MMTLSPNCSRYATRELVYLELYPPSTPNQTFSGAEYVGIIGRIEDYQRGDNVDSQLRSTMKTAVKRAG